MYMNFNEKVGFEIAFQYSLIIGKCIEQREKSLQTFLTS